MVHEIKNTDNFETGAFILNNARVSYYPFENTSSVFLTQENNLTLKKEIIKLIIESRDVLKICSFIITDREIFEAILNKAQNSNTTIFILTQLDRSKITNSISLLDFLTEEEIKENLSQTHLKFIKILYDNGVHVRASVSAHAKFIIADRNTGFINSANLTTPSLNFNTESGVYLDGESSKQLDILFDVIFQKGTQFRQFISSSKKNKMLVVQSEVKIQKEILPDSSLSNLRYTYENETNNLYDEIINIINEANEYLYISTYCIVGLSTIVECTQAIKAANSRGVNIYLFCRGMNYRNDHLIGSANLNSLGCEIYADMFNHSKGIINEKKGLIFTANIDGNHGLKNGFEVGYILNEKQRIDFLKFHKYLITISFFKFVSNPSRENLFNTYSTYETIKSINAPKLPNEITIIVNSDIKINEKELIEKPLFYGISKNEEYIIAGNTYFKCKRIDDKFQIFKKDCPRFDLEKYILKYSNLKIIHD
jgi:hypothetical protein